MVGPEAISSRDNQSLGKVPPHSLEAEEALLGSALLSRDAVTRLMEDIRPADFYSPSNQTVYEAMKGLFDTGNPIDTVTVSELIFKDSKNSTSINASYIARLVDNVPSSANFERYIEIVLEHSHRRKLLKASGRIELLAMAMDKEIHSVLDEAEQTIFTASDDAIGDGLVGVNDVLEGAIERIEEIENRGTGLSGLPTYFTDLDNYLSGLQEGNLAVIASRPSMGKSSLALNIGTNVAKEGKVVAFFSLEMTKEELVQRVLFSEAKVTSGDARKGKLGPEKWSRVVEAASKVNNLSLYFDDAPVITVTDIRAKSRRLKSAKSLDLIIVDYLQLMQSSRGDNRQQEIAEISRNLKNLARELKVPILALSQLNRAAEAREDKRPRLGDLRESGAIEQDADIVMMLYRDDYYNPGTDVPGVAEVNIVKNRSGMTGKVELFFSKEFTQFSNYSRQEQQ
ncbi:MAG: replicative DNA helicase [Actinobacteria bacterium]|jgi:replicative DNA helicase|nr:replicative DNA helicase [Actinomycetota bacterium]|tara:strand:+ start:2413 stop:3774 length:1362 start_codon:yes stop_codon:yes gene_type:complete